ncbi:sortase-dependent protein [Streptomyces sp. NPDC005970]|uniref:sortase-dependent protein n=1 Tax=Streptomyces sp. NPDC005970 TaxID=3156723 RepID=UPI0033DCF23A
MRRTVLSAVALACTAVLASTGPAFADEATPAPKPTVSAEPTKTPAPADQAPSVEPSKSPATAVPTPRDETAQKPAEPQVRAVPKGAPNTGVAEESSGSGAEGALIGGGAAALLAAGGAAVFVVRRRRATGA